MICLIERSGWCSEFAESWFLVMAGHVVPLDAIGVEVVEDGQAHLVVVSVVRLGTWGLGSVDERKMQSCLVEFKSIFVKNKPFSGK